MIYIVTALKPEAQAFIDKFKFNKKKLGIFYIFTNERITIIISGLGVSKAKDATKLLIESFETSDKDIFLNVGICGASKSYDVGELIEISSINYENKNYLLNSRNKSTIVCSKTEVSDYIYELADMESFGFYEAVSESKKIKNSYIFKVVSDNFEPKNVTKEKTKALIFKHIQNILKEVNDG